MPGLPAAWSGLTVLHLSDVHAGSFAANERNLEKVVGWAEGLEPDLVVLTGDVLGVPRGSEACLRLLTRLHPPLGTFAVTGNHEYGLSKAPLARPRDTHALWQTAGIALLRDDCIALPAREGDALVLCGADHLTGGYDLLQSERRPQGDDTATFPILLIHDPPTAIRPLADIFPLRLRRPHSRGPAAVPGPAGLTALHKKDHDHLSGVHDWGQGKIVITRGVGVGFLPFRLFTRPEATLWRLL